MVRFSEREYARLSRRIATPNPDAATDTGPDRPETSRRVATPMRWRCRTMIEKALPYAAPALYRCGEIIESEAAMRRHLPVHGVGATFECLPE